MPKLLLFEICVNSRIEYICENLNVVNNNQYNNNNTRYKFQHSTIHAVHLLTSNLNRNLNQKCTGACLIDFEKAFDTIWIKGLIFKLLSLGFSIKFSVLIY